MIEIVQLREPIKLDHYAAYAQLRRAVEDLRAEASLLVPKLKGRTVWMINSTRTGGGVAEMLPRVISMLRDLGVHAKWSVIHADEPGFFSLTKRLHNLIHGNGDPRITEADRKLYERVSKRNALDLRRHVKPGDVVIVHDPQPMGLGPLLRKKPSPTLIWRSHIGLDKATSHTKTAWRFLERYASAYDHSVFSAPEYVPAMFAGKASIIHPTLDPLSHKNRDLHTTKLTGILCNAGLAFPHSPILTSSFRHRARRLQENCGFAAGTVPEEIGLLFRPIITQVSRWDKLKGWIPLIEAFAKLKAMPDRRNFGKRQRRRIQITRLVLAGPDPEGVSDDPEAHEVLEQICHAYQALAPETRRDVIVLKLPMHSRKENALMVNALQRSSTIVVQNSIQEGFGLTATEAMFKRIPFVGTCACGLRHQVRDGIDGTLVKDGKDTSALADALNQTLAETHKRERLSRSAQLRVHQEFLVFTQVQRWLEVIAEHIR